MKIKERYEQLQQSQHNQSTISDIMTLKIDCVSQKNTQYAYYCDLLLSDCYMTLKKEQEAIEVCLKAINTIDTILYKSIYISFLDQLIYIYISKENYKTAYRYLQMKKPHIDMTDEAQVNRYYLEEAYCFQESSNINKAIRSLEYITKNSSDASILSLVYSNLTKLYIDTLDIEKAKECLNKCLVYVFEINDKEGKTYCDYLLAKLYVLEKNYKYAIKSYNDLFDSLDEITDTYKPIYLEFINLLIDQNEESYANKLFDKCKDFRTSSNLVLRRMYLKTELKLAILKNTKKNSFDFIKAISEIDTLSEQINLNENSLLVSNDEQDQNHVINNKLVQSTSQLEKLIRKVSSDLVYDTLRKSLIGYSKTLLSELKIDEMQIVVFDKSKYAPIIDLYDDYENIYTYQLKGERCYERVLKLSDIANTIFATSIESKDPISIDMRNLDIDMYDFITKKTYKSLGINYLVCLPIFDGNSLVASCLYLSKNNDITSNNCNLTISILNKLLENKMVSYFLKDCVNSHKSVMYETFKQLDDGYFFYKTNTDNVIFTQDSLKYFPFNNRKIKRSEYDNLIDKKEVESVKSIINSNVELKSKYKVTYHINLNENCLVEEEGTPYITSDGQVSYYMCTLKKVKFAFKHEKMVLTTDSDLQTKLEEITSNMKKIEYKFTLIRFRLVNLTDFDFETTKKVLEHASSVISSNLINDKCYFSENDLLVFLDNINDQRSIESFINSTYKLLNKGLVLNEKLIDINLVSSVCRYPRDTFNLSDLLEFSKKIINPNVKIQMFNDDLYRLIQKRQTISKLAKEAIDNNTLELVTLDVYSKSEVTKKEIKYNIRGLTNRENIIDYLNGDNRVNFELKVYDIFLRNISEISGEVYIHLSLETLDYIIKHNMIKASLDNTRCIIIISDYNNKFSNIVDELYQYGFRIIINYNLVNTMSLKDLNNKCIYGIYINEAIEKTERERMLLVFKTFNFEIFANYEYPDYDNISYRSSILSKVTYK